MMKIVFILLLILLNLNAIDNNTTKEFKTLDEDPLFHANRSEGFSLHEATNRAIEKSPKIMAATELVIQDKQKVNEAQAGHLPVVNLSGDAGYETAQDQPDINDPNVLTAQTTTTEYNKVDLYLSVTENLWKGGSIENVVDQKDANLKASLYDYRDKLEKLVVDVATAYFNVVYSEIAVKISKKNMKSYKKILKIVSIKEKNGAATSGDVNYIKANVENAKTQMLQYQKALNDAIANYNYLLQTQEKEYLPFETDTPLYIADTNTSLKNATTLNAKLLRQRLYIKATRFEFLATKGNFQPKVDLTLNAETKNQFDISQQGKRNKLNALLTFSYNLYNGGKDEATAVRLLSKMREQRYSYEDIKRNLSFDIKVLSQSVSTLKESLNATENEVLAARKVVKSYWIAFQHGTQDLQALQLAQRNLSRAEQEYASYKKNLLINNYQLMQKTGVLLKQLNLQYKQKSSEFQEDSNIFYEYQRGSESLNLK